MRIYLFYGTIKLNMLLRRCSYTYV